MVNIPLFTRFYTSQVVQDFAVNSIINFSHRMYTWRDLKTKQNHETSLIKVCIQDSFSLCQRPWKQLHRHIWTDVNNEVARSSTAWRKLRNDGSSNFQWLAHDLSIALQSHWNRSSKYSLNIGQNGYYSTLLAWKPRTVRDATCGLCYNLGGRYPVV